ncbi:MAG: ABC-F family ATP-binding cassette domain-containing protein [Maricaulaceae bacterium]|jgi:ATP-binding cassette subfamily F protein 3
MLHVNDITVRVAGRLLLDQATLALRARVKAGLVGRNGTGKTSLFKVIRGELGAEAGEVRLRKGARLASVDQEAPGGPTSILETVLGADEERAALLAAAETESDPHRIAEIQTRLADIAAHSAEARAAAILNGLGFGPDDITRPCADFSGGWRMRVALAGALFAAPDVLLLDEPTNYLDLEGAVWLEGALKRHPGAALVISHDRDLLNASVSQIVHLREGKLFSYEGGYDAFERKLAEEQTLQFKLKARQESERRRLQAFVDRFRAKASKARQAQSRVKRLEKMQPVATLVENPVAPFDFPAPQRVIAPPLIRLEKVSVGYAPDAPVLSNLNLRIDGDDRIALLGRNGAGKTTFAKLLCGRLEPSAGYLGKHKKLVTAYFAQHQIEDLNPKASAYDHVRERLPDATEAQRRARLGRFGLAQSKAETPAGDLSGGEKARLLLHLVTFDGAHVLILDEPTNHLDMDSRAALMDAVNDFPGAVILISHDRHLVESCADRLWLADQGTVVPYDGDMDDYRRLLAETRSSPGATPDANEPPSARAVPSTEHSKSGRRRDAAARRSELAPLKSEVERWERETARLEEALGVIDRGLASPDLYTRDPGAAAELSKKRAKALELIAEAETKWLEAAEALEQAQKAADA